MGGKCHVGFFDSPTPCFNNELRRLFKLLLYSVLIAVCIRTESTEHQRRMSSIHECNIRLRKENIIAQEATLDTYNGYLGFGLDFLTDEKTLAVLQPSYRRCRNTFGFLVPDFARPVSSHLFDMDVSGTIINSLDNFAAMKGTKTGVSGGYEKNGTNLSGHYSQTDVEIKSSLSQKNMVLYRATMSYEGFSLSLASTRSALSDLFRMTLEQIRDASDGYNSYIAQLLVRDFGTHIISKETAGSAIVNDTVMHETLVQNNKSSEHNKAGGGEGVSKNAKGKAYFASKNYENSTKINLNKSIKSKIVYTGGKQKPESTTPEDLSESLVSLRQGILGLPEIINTDSLPSWNKNDVWKVQTLVRKAIAEYLKHNTHSGCRNPLANNFNASANANDESACKFDDITTFEFGGISSAYSNRYTSPASKSCPLDFKEKKLSSNKTWCVGSKTTMPPKKGLLFGGFNSATIKNPNTVSSLRPVLERPDHLCPDGYVSEHLVDDIYICLAISSKYLMSSAIPFGGFSICEKEADGCPENMTAISMSKSSDCAIAVCIRPTHWMESILPKPFYQIPVQKPPFMKLNELGSFKSAAANLYANSFWQILSAFLVSLASRFV